MERPDICAASLAATRLLLAQRLHSLRLDITKLRYDRALYFDSMQHYCAVTRDTMDRLRRHGDTRDGLTLRRKRAGSPIYIVLYNLDAANIRRRSFTLAHEIGHIYLDHLSDSAAHEQEADHFAAQLLAPRILVEELVRRSSGTVTTEDVCSVFSVSQNAARTRLGSLREMCCYTDEDQELLRRFGGLLPHFDGPVVTI